MMAVASRIAQLTRTASLVFQGRVAEVGGSSVAAVRPKEGLAVVEVERGLRVDAAIGDLAGKLVTVEMRPESALHVGEQAIFFTRSWIHGENIAVHEIDHVDIDAADAVASAVDALPDVHLQDRMASAEHVVVAVVSAVRAVADQPVRRRAPLWERATLKVESALKGPEVKRLDVYFPTSDSHNWYKAPRFQRGQRGIFVLHAREPRAVEWFDVPELPDDALTALDPADFQPEQRHRDVARLVSD